MAQNGIPECDLKPAFLMLSGCETDLGKKARLEGNSTEAAEHYKASQEWLQKVYGVDTPTAVAETAPAGRPSAQIRAPQPRTNVPQEQENTVPAQSPLQSNSPSHLRILEREVKSLRDQYHQQRGLVVECRAIKRKLEKDLAFERDLRRKLQWKLETVNHELDSGPGLREKSEDREHRRSMELRAERVSKD